MDDERRPPSGDAPTPETGDEAPPEAPTGTPAPASRGLFSRMLRRGPHAEVEAAAGAEPEALALPADAETEGVTLRPARIVEPRAPLAASEPATPTSTQRIETREVEVRRPRPVLPTLPTEQEPPALPASETPAETPALEAPALPEPPETSAEVHSEAPALEAPAEDAGASVEEPAPTPEPEPEPLPPPSIRRAVPLTAQMAVITGLATVVTLAFVLIEPSPRWWLLLGAAAVVFGMDGVLRSAWRAPFEAGQETAPYLFLPALYMLAVPVLIEHNARGEWVLLTGLAGGLGFGALTWGEVASVRPAALEYARARVVVTSIAYFVAFAFFSLTYVFQVGLLPAMVAVGLATAMLSVELLREGEIDPSETLGFALVSGLVVAEGRWLIHYLPLDRYMAGLALLVVFYFATGVIHAYLTRQFTSRLVIEYGGIATAALALVALARAGGLA
ncbi:MAG: hypothetical protein AMXMBFR23_22290 [Chloroflexota bacterium]